MSDEKKTIPAPTPLVISRNNVSLTLTPKQFGKKSKNSGAWYQTPEISPATFTTVLPWFGEQFVCDTINKSARLIAQEILIGNVDETTGQLDEAKFALELADFTAGIAKLGDLEEDKEELEIQVNAITNDPEFEMPDEGVQMSERTQFLISEAKRLGKLIKPIRIQIADIEAKYALRAAKRKAKKEAAEKNAPVTDSKNVPVMS